jgi:hypothetical protein
VNHNYRENASTERKAAAVTELPNVRERHLRSVEAHEAMAAREKRSAERLKTRKAETAARMSDWEERAVEDSD